MGEGERGTKTTVLLLEAPYKDGRPRALAGAALIDLLTLGHSSCSVVYHTPSASYPCVSSAAPAPVPRQESPLVDLCVVRFQVRSSTRFHDKTSLPPARSLSYALSIVGLYSQCELCDVRLHLPRSLVVVSIAMGKRTRRTGRIAGRTRGNCGRTARGIAGRTAGRNAG